MSSSPITQSLVPTPLGEMLLQCSDKGVQGCWFIGQKNFPLNALHLPTSHTSLGSKHHQVAAMELRQYFDNQIDQFHVSLDFEHWGTPFQREVWLALLRIPLGHTLSYSEIASQINRPQSTRAVGSAIGKNPISIFIPCHRVIAKSGALTGYAGGVYKKEFLLNLETPKKHSVQTEKNRA
jgi:methylated-DNA-[protein]-cysteine S-methyltransferase